MSSVLAKLLLETMRPARMRTLRQLVPTQWYPQERLTQLNRDRTQKILRHAAGVVPFYQAACHDAGLDPVGLTPDDLAAFPLISKKEMMADRKSFLNPKIPASGMRSNATGGSSGIWFEFFIDAAVLEIRTANDLRARTWTGWKPGDKQAVLWGHPRDNKVTHSLRGKLLADFVHRSRNMNAYNMDDEIIAGYYQQLKRWHPTMILGYSSALAFLADYLTSEGLKMSAPKGIISSAETLTEDHRRSIEGYFNCPLLNRYGSREFGVIAQQCEQVGNLHIFNDRVHMEILRPDGAPCDPGERGEIVITDLDNKVMPFIRYRTGDLAKRAQGSCTCGRGFPLLESVEGRTSELIVGKNGKYYSCQSPRLFGADIPGIGQMQIIQETIEEITMKVVPDSRWTEDSRSQIIRRMTDLLGDTQIIVELVDEIPPAPSGKYPFTISKVSPFAN